MILFPMLGMVSCSEDEGTAEEFPNWQQTNETFFNDLSEEVKTTLNQDPANAEWKRIKSWSKAEDYVGSNEDYIIVYVKESAPATSVGSPIYTDSVKVHYHGNLLPSATYVVPSHPYTVGYRFDGSYDGEFNADTCVPTTFAVGNSYGTGLIDGFATALQHMRRGDHWVVYIPYQLGYGITAQNAIPGYSTLVFEINLVDFWN